MNKEISKGHEARLKIKKGIDVACDAVRPTLGAVGMTAIIENQGYEIIECDDGITILENIQLKDPYENMGVQKLRKAATRTSTEGGDGTATTTVLTQALVHEAFKEVGNDSSKIRDVRERLETGLKQTLTELSKLKRAVVSEEIEQIATISSLDTEVAKIIAEIINEVGVNGVVTVEKGAKLGYSKEVVRGARFNQGLISPYFIKDHRTNSTTLNDPYIILVDRAISSNDQIISILDSIGTGKDILFIAQDISSVALITLVKNTLQGVCKIACVHNPYTGSRASDFLFDIAALTNGTVISEETGIKLNEAKVELCGRAAKVVISMDKTTIIGGMSSEVLSDRVKAIEDQIAESTNPYEKTILEERLAALTGGIGVIYVGTYTDTEFNAKKYKFENAINSTQAALQEGIVAGGGVALAEVSTLVMEPMFKKALIAPVKQMAENAGMDSYAVISKVSSYTEDDNSWGFDFKTKQYVNMFNAGIIDPFKVTRLALESATAIASSLISVETVIVDVIDHVNPQRDTS